MGANHSVTARFTPLFPFNDTGITTCAAGNSDGLACSDPAVGTDLYPGQDAEHGRDHTNNYDSDGHAGFSFTKLGTDGQPLADQSAAYATTPWACVRDDVTGLVWEVKTDDALLHDKDWTYSWYNPDTATNGGAAGASGGGACGGTLPSSDGYTGCDTGTFPKYVNENGGLCGFTDWRVPSFEELRSIVDYSVPDPGPTIDTGYFPNTVSTVFWSASPYANDSDYAWGVFFNNGSDGNGYKGSSSRVRLVRGGE